MKVLITGAKGQLGGVLQAEAPAGVDLVALDRAGLDLADSDAIASALDRHKPGLILNAAAYTAVDKAESEPALAEAVNAAAPGLLAAWAARAGARLVHVSTDFVFDGSRSRAYPPDAPVHPLGVYGASKAAGERAVQSALPEALIVRTAWIYGAGGRNFVATMLRLMRERGAVRVVADQIGTPTHARSLARALWALSAAGTRGIHHFTDAGAASWYDFAVAIAEEGLALGLLDAMAAVEPIATEDYPTPAVRPAFSMLDCGSAWAVTGKPAHWRQELRMMLKEEKSA